VKNYLLGTLLKSFDGPFERIERFKALYLYHLEDNYYDRYTEAIRSATASDLLELANKWLKEDDLIELVVGKK
jgi:predicted Zn-dependent peptidase